MWKTCRWFAAGATAFFIAYARVAAMNPQDAPWYQNVLLWLSIGSAIIFLVIGTICLCNLLRGKKLEIDIHDSESKSKLERHGSNYKFDIAYALKTRRSPVEIARVLFHIQNRKLKAIELPFKLDDNIQSHVSKFEADDKLVQSLKEGDKYHLSIFALGKDWQSKEFTLDNMSVTVVPGTAHIKVPSASLEKNQEVNCW